MRLLGLWALLLVVILFAVFFDLPLEADLRQTIIWEIRLPRLIQGVATGAGLSLAGLLLQAVFSNPLCEPYTLGVSSGAALGTVLTGAFGIQGLVFGLSLPGIVGALVFSVFLVLLAEKLRATSHALLLTGVMLSLVGSSLVALVVAVSDPSGVQGALFWLLGDLSRVHLKGAIASLVGILMAAIFLYRYRHELDVMLLGETEAHSFGVDVRRFRKKMIWVSGLLVAICVGGAGLIGFIGLMVPHFSRRMGGALHQKLIPNALVLGAICLVTADVISRYCFYPKELPVGVVTALVGAPLYVWMLFRRPSGA